MAEVYNFKIDEGADTVTDICYLPNGEPYDLTNFSAKLQVRRVSSAPVIIELSSPNDGITVDVQNSKFYLLFSANKSLGYAGSYSYDLLITNSITQSVKKMVQGVISINNLTTK